ncbi:MAG: hypothetical protein Q4B85_03075 [Lachnospiraceae bacterium]|nr:hypothetical protein [Lachnospiraceae bacterium]
MIFRQADLKTIKILKKEQIYFGKKKNRFPTAGTVFLLSFSNVRPEKKQISLVVLFKKQGKTQGIVMQYWTVQKQICYNDFCIEFGRFTVLFRAREPGKGAKSASEALK